MHTYLLINVGTILIPLCLSFERRVHFVSKWPALFPAIFITAVPFLIWDHWFWRMNIWGFTPAYLSGVTLGGFPLEEILFFFCVPFSCVFIFEVVRYFKKRTGERWPNAVSIGVIALMVAAGMLFRDRIYTLTTAALLGGMLILLLVRKARFLGHFYLMYAWSVLPFIIVNGILTNGLHPVSADPVVWYDPSAIVGFRFVGIPVEDFFYSMLLLLGVVSLYDYLDSKKARS